MNRMRRAGVLLALCILLAISGCAGLRTKETFAACKGVDAVVTTVLVRRGGVELNPLLKVLLHWGPAPFYAAEAALVLVVWRYFDDMSEAGKTVVLAAGCVPAAINARQL